MELEYGDRDRRIDQEVKIDTQRDIHPPPELYKETLVLHQRHRDAGLLRHVVIQGIKNKDEYYREQLEVRQEICDEPYKRQSKKQAPLIECEIFPVRKAEKAREDMRQIEKKRIPQESFRMLREDVSSRVMKEEMIEGDIDQYQGKNEVYRK